MTDDKYTDATARIIEQLRQLDDKLSHNAADALEAQARRIAELRKEADMMHSEYKTARARIAELEAALKPFAKAADDHSENTPNYRESEAYFKSDPLRAARAAYRGEKDDG